eukprot:6342192-Prymnesium_polylepis.2
MHQSAQGSTGGALNFVYTFLPHCNPCNTNQWYLYYNNVIEVQVEYCLFERCRAQTQGGGVYAAVGVQAILNYNVFRACSAGEDGGALRVSDAFLRHPRHLYVPTNDPREYDPSRPDFEGNLFDRCFAPKAGVAAFGMNSGSWSYQVDSMSWDDRIPLARNNTIIHDCENGTNLIWHEDGDLVNNL